MQPTITTDRLQPFWAIVIVFLSNFCILVIELIAGRMMAPIVGVSLYTWTSIIGVVLAGISLGNYLGGKIADRWASRNVLALFFALSALGSMTILASLSWVGALQSLDLPIVASVVLIFTAVFLLPATILGTISPIVVKLTLNDLSQTGDIVGKVYAAGALGSIAGTFATGFFLISTFGTRQIVWGVAGALLLIGLLISLSGNGRWRYAYLGLFLVFLALSGLAWQQGWLNSHCLRETNYFCIKVRIDDENEDLRILTLDRLVHSYVDLTDPTNLRYGYEQIYANVLAAIFPDQAPVSVLFIGGGGYTFPHYIEVVHPGSQIDVIEIDPGVTAVAHDQLGLPLDTTITTFNEDARHFITNLSQTAQYDLIVGDAFNDFSVPYHLTTLEFNQLIATHLKADGIYMVNIIDGKQGDFLRAYVNTLQQTFSHVYVAATVGELGSVSRQTYVVLAAQSSLDTVIDADPLAQTFVPETDVAAYLQASPSILLTDDYVPVDNLLAPVFADSGS
ncbi:MAG: fused MFS/spermidine synthase [Anaerolineae bacterium]|nr:fused MFS/spermidine synthase [Anaerolineae bacterium]MCB9109050.1 fused MFS/spermidine synthase [Anaerolineales bacterium]